MSGLLAVLRAFWFLSLLLALVLAALVWWLLPLLPLGQPRWFESASLRALLIAAILLGWGGVNLWREIRLRQKNTAMQTALAGAEQTSEAERAELARRFAQATAALRRKPAGSRSLRDLPWFALIGPPRAGKTTALLQSGLRFASTLEGTAPELGTPSDTRQVEWYFTDEAVLLDTAGRYAVQEGDPADRAGWETFLSLLREQRPGAPLNGVLVVLEAGTLGSGPETIERHARLVRARLTELEQGLGVRLPIYLVLSKTDLLAGFEELLGGLEPASREQVLGFTLPWQPAASEPPARNVLAAELEGVAQRLEELLPRRLPELATPEERARALGFPAEIRALAMGLLDLVDRTFRGTLLDAPPPLRGVYLTSAIQAGSPVERLAQALAARLGLPAPPPPAISGRRSYFLTRLLREVVFREAGLAVRDPKAARRATLAWTAGALAMALVLLGTVAAWGLSWRANLARLAAVDATTAEYRALATPTARQSVSDDDPRPLLPPLDRLRRLAADAEVDLGTGSALLEAHPDPLRARLGLSLREDLEGYARDLYWHGLSRLLLPRLVLRLERDLARGRDEAQTREDLKAYLLLTGEATLDAPGTQLLRDRTLRDLQARFPREPQLVERLRPHIEALLAFLTVRDPQAQPAPGLEPDRNLIARAKALAASTPLAERAYASLRDNPAFRGQPAWSPAAAAGPDARLLRLGTGTIPWLFTAAGFRDGFVPSLDPAVDRTLAADRLLTGPPDAAARARLRAQVAALYKTDYVARWQPLLAGLGLSPPAENPAILKRDLASLGGPGSPLLRFLRAALVELRPAEAPDADLSGRPITDRFASLVALVEGDGVAEAPAAQAARAFAEAAQALGSGGDPNAAFAAAERLASAAAGLPPELGKPLQGVASALTARGKSQTAAEINQAWRDTAGFCQALTRRFPFSPGSAEEVSLDDFGKLLGPGGALDGFFATHLSAHVATEARPWRLSDDVGLNASTPALFEQAASLRRRFFIGASPRPEAGFTLRLVSLEGAEKLTLSVDGREVAFAKDTPPQRLRWPGDSPGCRLALEQPETPPAEIRTEGDWAFFRLLRQGGAGSGDRLSLRYPVSGRRAVLDLRPSSLEHPFDLAALARFRCPERL